MNNTVKAKRQRQKYIKNNLAFIATIMISTIIGVAFIAQVWRSSVIWSEHPLVFIFAAIVVFCVIFVCMTLCVIFTKNKELSEEKEKLLDLDTKLKESEILFRTIFEQAPIGIAIEHNDKYIVSTSDDRPSVNPMFEKITGRSKAELTGLSWIDITHPDDLHMDLENFKKFKSDEINGYNMEKRYIKPDNSETWVNMTIAPLKFDNASDYSHLCLIENINDRKEIEKALHDSERSIELLLNNLPGMAYRCNYDRDWTMQIISAGCFDLTGYRPKSLLKNKDLSFNQLILPEYRDIIWREWERVLALQIPFRYEYEIISASGERKWVLEMGQGVFDKTGNVEALEGIVIDITEKKKSQAQIKYMNDHNYLTGLYNRRYYEKAMIKMDVESCLPLSVIVVDINGVRLINETFGYAEGNKLIRKTSKILGSCCRPGDVLARLGGDEFGMLLPNTDEETANEMINEIEKACANYNENKKNKLYEISLSIGYDTKETEKGSIEETAKLAEENLRNRKLLNRKSSHSDIISSMMATIYERSHETEEHAKRIATLSKEIGEKLNLSQKCLGELELLAMLHDIGKVGINDQVLNKPGKLDETEWVIMKKHPEIGYRIAKSSSELEPIAEYILTHHERWDGKGYPNGLKGESIPLLSRIIAAVDAYDAMTEDRIYRKALTQEQAIEEIRVNAGTQFDPNVAKIFIQYITEEMKAVKYEKQTLERI